MAWLDLFTSGGIGAAVGAVGGVAEKLISKRMDQRAKKDEYAHIEAMHSLRMEADAAQAAQGLRETITTGEYAGLTASIEHDAKFKFLDLGGLTTVHPNIAAGIYIMQASVNAIRALFRPGLTLYALYLATTDPLFMGLASAATLWWVGSRGSAEVTRKLGL